VAHAASRVIGDLTQRGSSSKQYTHGCSVRPRAAGKKTQNTQWVQLTLPSPGMLENEKIKYLFLPSQQNLSRLPLRVTLTPAPRSLIQFIPSMRWELICACPAPPWYDLTLTLSTEVNFLLLFELNSATVSCKALQYEGAAARMGRHELQG